jgi:hypothetical protein
VFSLVADLLLPCPDTTDVKDETIKLSNQELHFKGTSEGKEYEVNIEFFKPVNSEGEGSTYKVLPRSVQMHVMKQKTEDGNDDNEFWPRLLKDKNLEKNQVKIDWDRCVYRGVSRRFRRRDRD